MKETQGRVVIDADGRRAQAQSLPAAAGGADGEAGLLVDLGEGRRLRLPAGELREREDGTIYYSGRFADLVGGAGPRAEDQSTVVLPVIEEELLVGRRLVETGRVRVTKTVREREEVVDEPLLREEVQVERVAVGRLVEGAVPEARREGETMIVPVLEEVLVVEKRLVLKEELHITRRRVESRGRQVVTLRGEEVSVDRIGGEDERRGE